jgi:hypothetical protein
MATARDKLVADWRHELHAAQDALAASPHRDWLLRMRVRLYRFLLACYGKANWRTTPAPADQTTGVVFDQPEAELLHGKPAKSAGKIQAVLKSVATAHSPPPQGTIVPADGFVVIATESSHANTLGVFAALKHEGIAVRHVVRDGQDVVEVRGSDFQRARWLLSCYQAYRSACRWRRGGWGNEFMTNFGVALATAPFIGLFASMLAEVMQGGKNEIVALVFCAVSVAWIVIFVSYRTIEPYLRTTRIPARRRRRHAIVQSGLWE